MKLVKNEKGLIFGAFLLAMLVASPMVVQAVKSTQEDAPKKEQKKLKEVSKKKTKQCVIVLENEE